MFRSLHRKLVLILVLLIVSVMAITGTFLINSVSNFYLKEFRQQVSKVFTTDVIETLQDEAKGKNGAEKINTVLSAYSGQLGIDSYRNYYVLNADGDYVVGSNNTLGAELTKTPNILAALAGKVGQNSSVADNYMDVAIPIDGADGTRYIVCIMDDKQEIQTLSWRLVSIVLQAMMFGLLAAILLSFLLSKTITIPIENITRSAQRLAAGDFEQIPVQSNDEIGTLTGTFNDMSMVLQQTLEAVQDERDKLNTLFLHMTDGVAAFTPDGKIIHMNPATEQMLGVQFDENMIFSDAFGNLSQPDSHMLAQKGVLKCEIVREDRTLNVLFAPYGAEGDGGSGVMAVIHDITEQRKLDDARREFVANVSHELRTPLTNIKSYTETLTDAAGDLPPETERKFLGVITGEADRMTRIVKDLLTLSKLDYGRMDLQFTRFSVMDMLESVYTAMNLDATNNGHRLTLDINGTLPEITGDRERLEQVVINIISNAVKYTPKGGHIDIEANASGAKQIRICVRDDGIGIPKEDIPRLFERFYRVDKARSRERGGTGLGLAIAREIVQAHKGTITLDSVLNEGTTVTILLPTDLPANHGAKE